MVELSWVVSTTQLNPTHLTHCSQTSKIMDRWVHTKSPNLRSPLCYRLTKSCSAHRSWNSQDQTTYQHPRRASAIRCIEPLLGRTCRTMENNNNKHRQTRSRDPVWKAQQSLPTGNNLYCLDASWIPLDRFTLYYSGRWEWLGEGIVKYGIRVLKCFHHSRRDGILFKR